MRRSSLALPARAIQRKRIHSLSTAGRLACALALSLLAAAADGCSGGGADVGTGDFKLTSTVTMQELSPNAQVTLTFILTDGGRPVPGQTVSFTTLGASTAGAQGATVATPSGVTGADGSVSVNVRAGLADFRVKAQIGVATAYVTIIVATGPTGTLLVAPFMAPSSSPLPPDATIDVLLYDPTSVYHPVSCADLDLGAPPASVRDAVTLHGLDTPARFYVVSTMVVSAAVGRAYVGGVLVASGCVDVPGSSLLADQTVEVGLQLTDWSPDPVGTYTVTSTLKFAPPLAAAAAVARPWTDLSDCPLDPAQLWLDCTVDALSPATSADPLDCVPSTAPGGEGSLGDAIAALRGVLLADGAGGPPRCRGAQNAAGKESVDALALGLFGSPTPAQLLALPAIAADAASIFDTFQLVSQLTVAPSGTAGSYAVTHLLTDAEFGPASQIPVTLSSLGLPVLTAFTSASVSDRVLVIGGHGFTLRLGTVARAAFGPLALVPRGLPADVPSFVSALFSLARTPGGTATGCTALDAVVCSAAARPTGCVMNACLTGLGALAAKLDGAFTAADGTSLDLSLSGTAPLIEKSGGGLADRLGSDGTSSSGSATWSVNLRTSLGSTQLTADFAGRRN